MAWRELDATSSWLRLTGRWLHAAKASPRSIQIHPDRIQILSAGLWDKGCPSRADPAKVQRLQPEHRQRRELVILSSFLSFCFHPPCWLQEWCCSMLQLAVCPPRPACSPKTLEVMKGARMNWVTLPLDPLPHKEVLGLYIRAWLSKITAVLVLPRLSGATPFLADSQVQSGDLHYSCGDRTCNCLQLREDREVIVPTRSNRQVCWCLLLVTVDDLSYYCVLLWVVMSSGAPAKIPARVQRDAWSVLSLPGKGGQRWPKVARWQFRFSSDVRSEVANTWSVNDFGKNVSDVCATKELQTPAELRPEFGAVRSER